MIKAQNSLGVVLFPAFDWSMGQTHPEREERLLYTQDQLKEEGLFDIEGIDEFKPSIAGAQDIERVHFCFPDMESVVTRSHRIAAGGAIKAAELIMNGQCSKAFALVRPPGHHAMKIIRGNRGFCNVNNEAVMVEWLREHYGLKRIAIIDTDCHHGDGTQDIYWHDPDVLFISIHQDGRTLYPGTGFPHESGGPKARGRTINIPLPPETGDQGFLMVIDEIVLPLLEDFKPELVINSAGQDNHFSDPITNMNFSAQGYAKLNQRLNPDIAVLEGGYAIQGALPYVNLGICLAMAGVDYSGVLEPNYAPQNLQQSTQISRYIEELCRQLPRLYFKPTASNTNEHIQDNWSQRNKSILYDSDGSSEIQKESLYLCENCRGLLQIESQVGSVRCLGLEVPLAACPKCCSLGQGLVKKARRSSLFRYIQYINRAEKRYERFGF